MDLGLIILNYNTREVLRECLRSLAETRNCAVEIVVVDNASSDGSAEMVRAEFVGKTAPNVRLIASAVNGGYAYGNNLALREFLTQPQPPRALMLLNSDTRVPPDALRQLMDFLDAHADAGVVGPKLVLRDGSLDLACRRSFPTPRVSLYRMIGLSKLFPKSKRFGQYNLTFLDENETAQVDSVVGAAMLMRTDALRQAGILDETFFMYSEEVDYCRRLRQAGWEICWVPQARVVHLGAQSTRQAASQMFLQLYLAKVQYFRKHYGRFSARLYKLILFGAGMARLAAAPLIRTRPSRQSEDQQAMVDNYQKLLKALPGM